MSLDTVYKDMVTQAQQVTNHSPEASSSLYLSEPQMHVVLENNSAHVHIVKFNNNRYNKHFTETDGPKL